MKRFTLLLLTLLLCFCVSCSETELSPAETKPAKETENEIKTETKITQEAPTVETTNSAVNPEYTESTVDLIAWPDLYKTYGRTFVNEKGLNVNFGGNGFEFEVECGGEVFFDYNCEYRTYFQIYVDGEAGLRVYTGLGEDRTIRIADKLDDGVHRFRIIRDTDATKVGEVMAIKSVRFTGKAETFKATEAKPLYLEFVGDSITAGKYTEMQYVDGAAIHKATNSYAYLTAEAMNADFSMLARGGCGYFRVNTCPRTMNQLYPYYNGFENEPTPYTPARKADVVVLALGTNDSKENVKESYENGTVPFATFEEALIDQIKQIRQMNGADVKIVLLHNMMSSSWEKEIRAVAEQESVYFLSVTKNREGGRNHPSIEGHETFAKELTKFLQETVLK